MLVSRYLIENNDEPYIILDLKNKNDIKVVKSIFKNLVGNYHIDSEEDEKEN